MSADDAVLLLAETAAWHLHVATVLVVDPPERPSAWFQRLRTVLAQRLPHAPRACRRLVEVPFGLDRPLWARDADLDLDFHLRRVGTPSPGGPGELAELLGDLLGHRLDRRRPLWEVWAVERLAEGRVAVVVKEHHVALDPVTGSGLVSLLVDARPDPPPPPDAPPPEHDVVPDGLELAVRGLRALALAPVRVVAALPAVWLDLATELGFLPTDAGFAAPRTSLDQELTPHRSVAWATVARTDVDRVRQAFGVTTQDVTVALASSALRAYLLDRGELPDQPLVAEVPMAVPPDAGHGRGPRPGPGPGGTARVAPTLVSLATHLDDPVARLRAVHESARGATRRSRTVGIDAIRRLGGSAPPGLVALAARAHAAASLGRSRPPHANALVAGGNGDAGPRWVAGARVVTTLHLPSLGPAIGCAVTATAGADHVDVAVLACRESVPVPSRVAAGVPPALADLVAAVGAEVRPRRAPTPAARGAGRTGRTGRAGSRSEP